MKWAYLIAVLSLAFPLWATLNPGAQVVIAKEGQAKIERIETQQIVKKWSPTRTFTPNGKQATATPTATSTTTPDPKAEK